MKVIYEIENMRCKNCVRHITEALEELEEKKSFKIDLKSKTVTVEVDQESETILISEKLQKAGYPAVRK